MENKKTLLDDSIKNTEKLLMLCNHYIEENDRLTGILDQLELEKAVLERLLKLEIDRNKQFKVELDSWVERSCN